MSLHGDLLRALRRSAGLRQADLAEAVGVSIVHISNIEKGQRGPLGLEQIRTLARLVNGSPKALIRAAAIDRLGVEFAKAAFGPDAHLLSPMRIPAPCPGWEHFCCVKCHPDYPGMPLCRECGNKRCPHATDHDLACTDSNEPGQVGSRYGVTR